METPEQQLAKLLENPNPEKFDTRVHIRDARGNMVHKQPYKLHIIGGKKYYERPVGSGNLWYENNESAGRMLAGNIIDKKADHIDWIPPKTGAEKLYEDLATTKQQLDAARAEIDAIKKEQKIKKLETADTVKGDN